MSLVNAVVKFLSDVKPVSSIEDLEEGRAAAEGVIRIGEDGPLISPVRGNHCVAFYYKAFHLVGSRSGQMMPRKLQTHEVYHSFDLEMTGGKIKAIPKKTEEFSPQDHKALSGVGYEGFRATEDLVSAGVHVKIFGIAKKNEDGWVLEYNKLEVVQTQENGASVVGKTVGKVPKKKAKQKAKPKKKKAK